MSQTDGAWEEEESPGKKQWPHADDESGRVAVVSPLDTDQVWVYYTSGEKVLELHKNGKGTWADARTPDLKSATNVKPDSDKSDGSGDSTDSGSSEEATDDSPTGITTGAKAGIGVGVGVGVLAIAAAGFLFLRRRRQQAASDEGKNSVGELASRNSYHELSTEVHEPQEMPSNHAPQKYELLGDTGHRAT